MFLSCVLFLLSCLNHTLFSLQGNMDKYFDVANATRNKLVVDKAMQGVKPLSWQALNGGIPSEGWY